MEPNKESPHKVAERRHEVIEIDQKNIQSAGGKEKE